MPRRLRIALGIVLVAIACWWGAGPRRPAAGSAPQPSAAHRTAEDLRSALARSRVRLPEVPFGAPVIEGDGVVISGHVIDVRGRQPVGGVEVVFRSMLGESSAEAGPDGAYAIHLAPGMYHVFVRDEAVLSVGLAGFERLPAPPSADTAGVPDESLMPLVIARADMAGIDLSVVRGGVVAGRVVDRGGRPIRGAVVHAQGGRFRPVLATDLAETDADGGFELRLPAGEYDLEPSHPRFAGIADPEQGHVAVEPGARQRVELTLTAGCVISGRVIRPGGTERRPLDGALERQLAPSERGFVPAGRIEPDGTFRWATTLEAAVTLRAWPWKSPPSPAQQFACSDGARFEGVVFQLPERAPDIAGVLVDQAGAPVGSAYIDLVPLGEGGFGQQERTDEAGRWAVYDMPPGPYQLTAHAEGRGVVSQRITSPQQGLRLTLRGTGRLEGRVPGLQSGSFELVPQHCIDAAQLVPLPPARRMVTVRDGQFSVEDLPACRLKLMAISQGWVRSLDVEVPSGGTAHVTLDVGPPRLVTVRGVVRNRAGEPIAGAFVVASGGDVFSESDDSGRGAGDSTTTDTAGGFVLQVQAGGTVNAFTNQQAASAPVSGGAGQEQIDLVLEDIIADADPDEAAD